MQHSTSTRPSQATQLTVPWDLTEWLEEHLVLEWVRREIDALNWSNPKLQEYLQSHPEFRPRLLLSLVSWAYATGRFESSEIEEACLTDPRWSKECADQPPSTPAIARFRRENRGLIKWVLARVYRQAVRNRFDLGDTRFPAGLTRYLEEAAFLRLDLARQMDRGSSGF